MASEELYATLQNDGVVLLRNWFEPEWLTRLREAASRCFGAIEAGNPIPKHCRYSQQSHAVQLTALLDFGIESEDALTAPVRSGGLNELFSALVGRRWRCRLEHSWLRKKFAPRHAPPSGHHIQDWHQDGALGATFPPQPGQPIAATNLATCWIPLSPCGMDAPGLEFIRKPLPALLHFSQLNDATLRERFDAEDFWAPVLQVGKGLLFGNHALHRTHVHDLMSADRISLEYRVFLEAA